MHRLRTDSFVTDPRYSTNRVDTSLLLKKFFCADPERELSSLYEIWRFVLSRCYERNRSVHTPEIEGRLLDLVRRQARAASRHEQLN